MKYLLLFFSVSFYGQVLHHQMISSQGVTKKIATGQIINQTIGQQSSIGTSNKEVIVMQGFQQSLWVNYIASNEKTEFSTTTYPNPFTDLINFQFSKPIEEDVSVFVFDISGRLVLQQKKMADNSILTIDLSKLPRSEYLVKLQNNTLTYYTKIIKL